MKHCDRISVFCVTKGVSECFHGTSDNKVCQYPPKRGYIGTRFVVTPCQPFISGTATVKGKPTLIEVEGPMFASTIADLKARGATLEWFRVRFPRNALYQIKLWWPDKPTP